MFFIKPKDIERAAIKQGLSRKDFEVPSIVFLSFNQAILDELSRICGLKEYDWRASKFSPYYNYYRSWKGMIGNNDVSVFFPPMGASVITAFCEDLIYFGATTIFLLCASWSLGKKCLNKGQIHLPSFAVGLDGTSIHYGNKNYRVNAEPIMFNILAKTLDTFNANWKAGGVGTCEAIYRIDKDMIERYRKQNCLSMENGETAVLYSLAKTYPIQIGVLLQPYIDIEQGWKMSYLDELYKKTCQMQARVAVEAARILLKQTSK